MRLVGSSWLNGDGLYIRSFVQGVPISLLVDTGANISILSVDFFENLCENVKPPLVNVTIAMMTARGEVSPFHGKVNFSVALNGKDFIHKMWVAQIKPDGRLGMAFLMKHKCDVMLSQQMIKFGNNSIPCYKSSIEVSCCRVIVAETTDIPANSESILQGKVMDVEAN